MPSTSNGATFSLRRSMRMFPRPRVGHRCGPPPRCNVPQGDRRDPTRRGGRGAVRRRSSDRFMSVLWRHRPPGDPVGVRRHFGVCHRGRGEKAQGRDRRRAGPAIDVQPNAVLTASRHIATSPRADRAPQAKRPYGAKGPFCVTPCDRGGVPSRGSRSTHFSRRWSHFVTAFRHLSCPCSAKKKRQHASAGERP